MRKSTYQMETVKVYERFLRDIFLLKPPTYKYYRDLNFFSIFL